MVCCPQASTDPEYQALLAAQAGGQPPSAEDAAALGGLSQQQKEAGLASVFKRDDENLARRSAQSPYVSSLTNLLLSASDSLLSFLRQLSTSD